jgi:hypothetical protein
LDFVKCKEQCLFCKTPLRAILTNFVGLDRDFLPILNIHVPIKPCRFTFQIHHITSSYDIKANGMIDTRNNTLIFTLPKSNPETSSIDRHLAKQVFDDLRPHFDLYCNNNKCSFRYHLASNILQVSHSANSCAWVIAPIKLYLEGFEIQHSNVINDWIRGETQIHSTIREVDPIRMPIIDFEQMPINLLLTRIATIKTWS